MIVTTSRFVRVPPVLLVAGVVLVLGAAGLLAACGGSDSSGSSSPPTSGASSASNVTAPPATPTPSASPSSGPSTTSLTIYFVRNGALGVAERVTASTTAPATAAMKTLLGGPSGAEVSGGLSSDIPAGTSLNSLSLDAGTATVDLSSDFAAPAANAVAARRVAQVVFTLTRFPTVARVALLVDGKPLTEIPSGGTEGSPDALTVDGPQARTQPWTSFEPAIFVEDPGAGAALTNPFVLSGSASVFEGSFTARLVDSSGRRVASATVQASRGAPGRGRFSQTIAFSTAAASGTLIVYSQSMEDGSRQNEVSIPVTFVK